MRLIKWLIISLMLFYTVVFAQTEIIVKKVSSLNDNFQDIVIDKDKLFALSNTSIKIYDIKEPSSPTFLTSYDIKREAKKLAIYKNYLYIGDGEDGALFLDVSDINDIYIKLSYTNKEHHPYGVVVRNDISYQADGKNGINIVDISDPYNSYIISSFENIENALDVDIKDDLLYVASGKSGINVLDISDIKHLYIVNSLKFSGFINDIKIKDNIAFLADKNGDLITLDISDPFEIYKIPNNCDGKNIVAVDIKDEYVYVVNDNGELNILKIQKNLDPTNNEEIKDFVNLLYKNILYRDADKGGLNYWALKLQKRDSAVEVIERFLESEEFIKQNVTDREFVTMLYNICLNREPDPAGLKYWLNKLNNGYEKKLIIYEFAFSKEFEKVAKNRYKIVPYNENDKLKAFIIRLYNFVLEREGDGKGVNYWLNALNNGEKSIEEAVLGFFNSQEFKDKNLNDEEFIKIVYKAILDREADENGLRFWVKKLQDGVSRTEIIKSFLKQPEFQKVVKSFTV